MMKITDEELLDLIWEAQLRHTAKDVIHHYIGGGIGLCDNNDTWYMHSCDLHISHRGGLTKKIGRKQLLLRIRRLAGKSKIKVLMKTRRKGKENDVLTYMIDCKESRAAFEDARRFWSDHGVPSGCHKLEDGREPINTTKYVYFEGLVPICQAMLIEKYGDVLPNSTASN